MSVEKATPTYDVIVVGSGASGLTAAIVAAQSGLKALVVEKTEYFGGTTALSGGGLWVPNNPHMQGNGLNDSPEKADTYLRSIMGDFYDAKKVAGFLEAGPAMVSYMEANTEVQFAGLAGYDYEAQLDGAAAGRTLRTLSYDGTQLGHDLAHLRPALDQLGVFGGMQIGFEDAAQFMGVLKSVDAFVYSGKRFLRYVWDRIRHGKTTHLVNGNALAARLLKSAKDAGVTLWHSTPVKELVIDKGHVRGVVVKRAGHDKSVWATRAVILASGGYGANQTLREDNIPMAAKGWSLQPEGTMGDGIRIGECAGGVFVQDNIANGIWAPMSSMLRRDGTRVNFSHIMLDRHCPGQLVVNLDAKRFVNEGLSYQAFCDVMHKKGVGSAWLIASHASMRRYSMGLAKAFPLPIGRYLKNGYLKKAQSIAELAGKIGLSSTDLVATVDTFNAYADAGHDPEFRRGDDPYSKNYGDLSHKPNSSLGALRKGPFYAVQLYPGELSTLNGLETNEYSQVLRLDQSIVPGLYAVGVDANSVFRGAYPGGGSSLGPGMTFAYIAAQHIAS